jgi:hypothetical protein
MRISDDPQVQAAYERIRSEGGSHNLAEMLALGQPPNIKGTDSGFLKGHCNGSQFEKTPSIGNHYLEEAKRHGIDVKGKVYLSQLATFPGDPRAWVADQHDVQKVCEERGWGCEGAVNVKSVPLIEPPAPPPAVAPDIVDGKVAEILQTVPAVDRPRVDIQDLREQVVDKIAPPWAK